MSAHSGPEEADRLVTQDPEAAYGLVQSLRAKVERLSAALVRIDGFNVNSVAHLDARTITEMRDVAREALDGR